MGVAGYVASHHEVRRATSGELHVSRANHAGVRRYLSPVLVLILVILGVFPAVDVDGDPTTPNVPTVVLVSETRIPAEDGSVRVKSPHDAVGPCDLLSQFVRHLIESARRARHRYRPPVWSIRGP